MLRTRVRMTLPSSAVTSALMAVVLVAVGSFELYLPSLAPRYDEPAPLSVRVPLAWRVAQTLDPEISSDESGGIREVTAGRDRVVARGTVLSADVPDHRIAIAFDRARRPPQPVAMAALGLLYGLLIFLLSTYFRRYGHPRLLLMRSQLGIFAIFGALGVATKLLLVLTGVSALWVPLSALGLWISLGFERRAAAVAELTLAVVVSSLVGFDPMLLAVLAGRGLVATLAFRQRRRERRLVLGGVVGGVVAAAILASLLIYFGGPAAVGHDLRAGLGSRVLAALGGGVLSGLVANVLREPALATLGFVTRSRLLDLTDIESPLLRKMAAEAPGSWEHSRAMANLAEAAAAAIGADALLTRVGAYYHDLGKTVQHKYFVENLAHGERSPHEDLEPEISADAIMAHVVLGTRILRDGGVPEPVVEFAYTHHGTQLVEFFWNKYRESLPARGPDHEQLTEAQFRYPGMKPLSKETAILMLVDSIEAASRTVQPPEHDKFEEMIRRVLFHKIKSGQLEDSGLTLSDLKVLGDRMAATLVNMYHGRIKYPWQQQKEQEEAEARARALEAATPATDTVEIANEQALDEPPSIEVIEGELLPPVAPVEPPSRSIRLEAETIEDDDRPRRGG
jgi:cyclic-di-AMP phosphodiesterase PgpH